MSGPKVISIVSREEVIETCEVLLAQVDAEIAEWVRIGHRYQVISKADEASVREIRVKLARLLETGQFVSLQKEAPMLVQWLRSDIDERLERAENSRMTAARQIRSLHFAAMAVLRAAKTAGIELPPDVASLLLNTSRGCSDEIASLEKAVLRGIELTKQKQAASSDLSILSRQLSSDARTESLDDWMEKIEDQQDSDKRFTVADKLLSQIRVFDEQFSSESFQGRLQEIALHESSAKRSLLLDAICIELKSTLTKASEAATVRRRLGDLRIEAEVSGGSDEVNALLAEADSFQQSGNPVEAKALIARIEAALSAARIHKSGEKKRQALIQGLNEIGYRVNAEMSEVWTRQKQLLVRSSSDASIGIELGGNLDAGRCQVRVVSLEREVASGPPKLAKDHEEQWCSDLQKLQEKLEISGASLRIEKATAAGVVPLKVVKGQWSSDFEEVKRESEPGRAERKRSN